MQLCSLAKEDDFGYGKEGSPHEQPFQNPYESVEYRDSELYYDNGDSGENEYTEIEPTQFDSSYGYLVLKPGFGSPVGLSGQTGRND